MKLSQLLAPYLEISAEQDCEITGLALDSRQVQPGDLFFAYPGGSSDGRDYVEQAVGRGARVIVYEGGAGSWKLGVGSFGVDGLRDLVGPIAARFYGNPSHEMTVIGITGTNGKTSVAHFTAQALAALNKKVAVIGTLGSYLFPTDTQADRHTDTQTLTTPSPIALQQQLAEFKAASIECVIMEVSSHALDQHRVDGIEFDVAAFTNLSRDHLDYHQNMDAYFAAKKRLFTFPELKAVVINDQDAYGKKLMKGLAVKQIHPNTPASQHPNLIGQFNQENIATADAILQALGIPVSQSASALADVTAPPGRMQAFGGGKKPLVIVDFAHTPDALEKLLTAVRRPDVQRSRRSDIHVVFGCGGDRDPGKRAMMGKIAEQHADHVIITSDNPRSEDPVAIAQDICSGLCDRASVTIELDRELAIKQAIKQAKPGDVVLIAGKGHEAYQLIGSEKKYFSDQAVVLKWI